MLDHPRIHQMFIAILTPPLVLAAGRVPDLAEGGRGGRLNTLAIWRR
jgi:hypothetical protein